MLSIGAALALTVVEYFLEVQGLHLGAVVMTIGSGVQLPLPSGAITNAFELALMVSIMATKAIQDRNDASAPVSPPARRARG